MGRELARIEGQASYMKTRFNIVKAKFPLPQRQLLADAKGDLLGYQIDTRKSAVATRVDQSRRRTAANKSRADRLRIPRVTVTDDDDSRRALDGFREVFGPRGGEVEITEGTEQ